MEGEVTDAATEVDRTRTTGGKNARNRKKFDFQFKTVKFGFILNFHLTSKQEENSAFHFLHFSTKMRHFARANFNHDHFE